jgi:hypothetical protein
MRMDRLERIAMRAAVMAVIDHQHHAALIVQPPRDRARQLACGRAAFDDPARIDMAQMHRNLPIFGILAGRGFEPVHPHPHYALAPAGKGFDELMHRQRIEKFVGDD